MPAADLPGTVRVDVDEYLRRHCTDAAARARALSARDPAGRQAGETPLLCHLLRHGNRTTAATADYARTLRDNNDESVLNTTRRVKGQPKWSSSTRPVAEIEDPLRAALRRRLELVAVQQTQSPKRIRPKSAASLARNRH